MLVSVKSVLLLLQGDGGISSSISSRVAIRPRYLPLLVMTSLENILPGGRSLFEDIGIVRQKGVRDNDFDCTLFSPIACWVPEVLYRGLKNLSHYLTNALSTSIRLVVLQTTYLKLCLL